MTLENIARKFGFTALIGMLVLVLASAASGKTRRAAEQTDDSGPGNETAAGVLHDMSTVMEHWMVEMSDPNGLSAEEAHRLAGQMQTMSGMMKDMSSMMQTASRTGSKHDAMTGDGHGMMTGAGHSRMMNSQAMQKMHEQMKTLLANEKG